MKRLIALMLFRLAYKLYPNSEATAKMLQKMVWSQLLQSKAVVSVDLNKIYKAEEGHNEQ